MCIYCLNECIYMSILFTLHIVTSPGSVNSERVTRELCGSIMDLAKIETDQVMADKDIKVRKVTSDRNIKRRKMLYRTVCHGLVIFTIGMTLAMRGPSFMDLQLISGVDVERGSFYYTASAFGYVIGAFFTGVIYTRVKVKDMLIIGPMIVSAIFFSATPWCTDFVLMMGVHVVMSFFGAITETTVNTEEVKRWEGNSNTAMQCLSFAYSLGGIIGPLIVEPFLAPKDLATTSNLSTINHMVSSLSLLAQNDSESANISHDLHSKTHLLFTTAPYLQKQGHQNESEEELNSDNYRNLESGYFNNSSVESNLNLALQTNIHYAFFIGGCIIVLSSFPICVLHIRARKFQQKHVLGKIPKDNEKRLPLKMYIILTGLLSMFYFFYTTIDDPYSMYLSTFVVSYLDWSKEDGAIVSSLYWGCSTATKLAMIVLVHHINPSLLLFCSCLGMVIFMIVLTICAYFHVHFMIWVCTALMALSQSGLFGGAISWVDTYLLRVDDKVTSCVMIISSLGAMLAPMLLGVMMKELSPMAFPCLLIFEAFITLAIFLVMLLVFKPYVTRMYGPPRAEHQEIKVVEENDNLFEEDI